MSLSRVQVRFETEPVDIEPEKDGPLAGCPQWRYLQYTRWCRVDRSGLFVLPPNDKITFYGDEYKIVSLGLSHPTLTVRVTESELVRFLAKAKEHRHRWRKAAMTGTDARRLVAAFAHQGQLH